MVRPARRRGRAMPGVVAVVFAVCAACGSSGPTTSEGPAPTVRIVASTDVYGDIAGRIAGADAAVTSIIDTPGADPHAYEASPQDQLALSKADIVVRNGGGYDDFMDTLLASAGNPQATVLDAVAISGRTAPDGEDLNEHVWYDIPSMEKLTRRLVAALSDAAPASASVFRANGEAFLEGLAGLDATIDEVRVSHAGTGVAITEPVPLYLLEAMGLENRTPPAFSEAIEAGTGVPVAVLKQTTDLLADHRVALVVYNAQTGGPETDRILRAAQEAGIPTVGVTETLPEDVGYLEWMGDQIDAIAKALG